MDLKNTMFMDNLNKICGLWYFQHAPFNLSTLILKSVSKLMEIWKIFVS